MGSGVIVVSAHPTFINTVTEIKVEPHTPKVPITLKL